jgi:hypothetical protein
MKIFVNAVICGAIFGIMDMPCLTRDWWKVTLGIMVGSIIVAASR